MLARYFPPAGRSKTVFPVAIALGSNVGDREATLRAAVEALGPILDDIHVSTFSETAYVGEERRQGVPGDSAPQPAVLNGALVGVTALAPRPLLDRLLAIEQQFGRTRPYPGAPRTLDLDLILHGMAISDEPGLVVPHPRFRQRLFVLEPLAEIAPGWKDPVTGQTVEELLRALTQ